MIYTLFLFLVLALFQFDSSYSSISMAFLYVSIVLVIIGIAHVFLITIAVVRDSAVKNLGAKWIWGIFTFIGGIPMAFIYALFTHKAGKYNEEKGKKKNIIIAILSVVLCLVFVAGCLFTVKYANYYQKTHFSDNDVYFETSTGEKVIYDKMGNTYTAEDRYEIKFYDRQGNSYSPQLHYDVFSDTPDLQEYINDKTNEIYAPDGCDYYVDSEGYLVYISDEEDVEYLIDDCDYIYNGEVYYSPDNCYWTPDGELKLYTDFYKTKQK